MAQKDTTRERADAVDHHLEKALRIPGATSSLQAEELALALDGHRRAQNGPSRATVTAPRQKRTLARWQEQRAKELLAANPDGGLTVAELARECGLSRAHFSRAFRESTGLPPRQWLAQRRVELAKELLLTMPGTLLDVARATGFATHSHFTNAFSRATGVAPGEWRRTHGRGPGDQTRPSDPAEGKPNDRSPTPERPGIYGEQLADCFRFEHTPALTTHIQQGTFAITRACSDHPDKLPTSPLPAENAFLVNIHLRDITSINLWCHRRHVYRGALPAGTIKMMHMSEEPSASDRTATDTLHVYFTFPMIEAIARDSDLGRFEGFRHDFSEHVVDPFMEHVGRALVPSFQRADGVSQLFLDHVALAMQWHMLKRYGNISDAAKPVARGGLARWQSERAKELLAANIDGRLSIEALARECSLSRSHFVRAFKASVGVPPHRWLSLRRIELAKTMLLDLLRALTDIATACGFASQSHFTRVFTRYVGTSPAAWRRANAAPMR